METLFFKHFVTVDKATWNILDGWSDGVSPGKVLTENDICIREDGGYQFRLYPDGEENPPLTDADGIPLYQWSGRGIVSRETAQISEERAAVAQQKQKAERLEELHKLLSATDYIACKIAEGAATREEYAGQIAQRQAWRDEINSLSE